MIAQLQKLNRTLRDIASALGWMAVVLTFMGLIALGGRRLTSFASMPPCNAQPLLDRKRLVWRFQAVMRRQLDQCATMAAGTASTVPTQDIAAGVGSPSDNE